MLQVGQKVICELIGKTYSVKKKLGEGGQGIVYLVEGGGESKALKWYNLQQSTEQQRQGIRRLASDGPIKGAAGKRFVWPIDLAVSENPEVKNFGYIMDIIDMSQYADLGEVWARRKPVPGMKERCKISYQLADSYQKLHLAGYCYTDISRGNYMFNPKTGDVLICDNDNIGINKQSKTQVCGTMDYMAPEVILGTAQPSTDTDMYSLAVLLFEFWMWHHPMHGNLEYNIRVLDIPAKKRIYGEKPIFIFHPNNKENSLPVDSEYDTPRRFWQVCPEPLKKLFTQAFTEGVTNPEKRVTEGEWRKTCLELSDCIVKCPKCNAENFWYEGLNSMTCWHCKKQIDLPVRLCLRTASGKRYLVLGKGTQLLERNISHNCDDAVAGTILGEVVQNPQNPSMWGLRNLTSASWKYVDREGVEKEVQPQRALALQTGLKVNFGEGAEGSFEK